MQTAEAAMHAAQEAANGEEKSSAGDKYETSRAMGHLDRDMNARQLVKAREEMAVLNKIDTTVVHRQAALGSLVQCSEQWYFVAIGLGSVDFEGRQVVVVSAVAPLARLLLGKKKADTFVFNQKTFVISEVL